ncbi:MAG TPA: hypothetical protein VGL56_17525 [Fimbriimonadaceae bacterium]|jgi:hypothetical protein
MHAARSRTASAIAALLLSALVLFTFYILRNYGPAQAINRFHAAALANDQSEIARVTVQTPNTPEVVELEHIVRQARAIQVQSVSQNPGEAIFLIAYLVPQGQVTVHWIVDQSANAGWLIDAKKTLNPNQ